jgi:[acyl-carrier-protein] S-malonyltransferase
MARPVTEAASIKKLLVEQVYSPVRWVESVEYLTSAGFQNFVEVGPGKVLQGLLRRINPAVKIWGVSDKKSLEKTCEEIDLLCQD